MAKQQYKETGTNRWTSRGPNRRPNGLKIGLNPKNNQLDPQRAFNREKGFTLIELVLAITLFVIIASGVAVPIIGNHLNSMENQKTVQANAVLTETWEAIRSIRNRDWANMTNQTHGLRNTNGYWEFFGSSDTANGFDRNIIVSDISRDANGNIVESGGTVDSDSKKIEIQVSWQPTPYKMQTLEAESLLTNYISPGVWPPA